MMGGGGVGSGHETGTRNDTPVATDLPIRDGTDPSTESPWVVDRG